MRKIKYILFCLLISSNIIFGQDKIEDKDKKDEKKTTSSTSTTTTTMEEDSEEEVYEVEDVEL